MKPLIEVNNLSKRFYTRSQPKGFWALKDINFKLEHGENLAIVGHNGSGKSTLLKILSNVLMPTSGAATIRGKMASLLELGTGFHPDLTGRENIYFYGAVLGFSKREIKRAFDAIIDFSGVEAFIDTPIRNYSSGMQMRLAFSVATFMQSDVLLVDEVLAVGDISFQNKCIRKIHEDRKKGRGLIFVSHYMSMVTSLCHKSILLEDGIMKAYDQSKYIADIYSRSEFEYRSSISFETKEGKTSVVQPISGRVLDTKGEKCQSFDLGEAVIIEMGIEILKELEYSYIAGFHIYTVEEVLVFPANHQLKFENNKSVGKQVVTCELPGNLLNTGVYRVTLVCTSWKPVHQIHFKQDDALTFEITEVISKREIDYYGDYPGIIRPKVMMRNLPV